MEIARWKTRTFIPRWGGNDEAESPCSIRYTPPTVAWMSRWREAVIGMPTALADPEAVAALATDEKHQASLREWEGRLNGLRNEMIRDLIVGVEGLTADGKAVDLAEAIEFIEENPGLSAEVFQELVASGGVDIASGKD